jgi:TolB protein
MRSIAFVVYCLLTAFLMTAGSAQNADSPVITIRKGNAIVVELKGLEGAGGGAATAVLRNDIQLSGALSLGDAATSTISISGSAAGGTLSGIATDKSGGAVLRKSYTGETRHSVHEFVNDLVLTLTGQKGIALSRIAFVADRTGHKEIYTADYDGARAVQLTHDNAISMAPNLSADGRKLVYTGYQSGYADIYLIDLATGARNRIIKYPGTNTAASIAPGGDRIACIMSKDGSPQVYTTALNGSSPRMITRSRGTQSTPTWSPNGFELAYCSDQSGRPQIYRISTGGGSGRLISMGFSFCTEPNWSPDGKKIAFNVRSGGSFQIAVLDLSSGANRTVANEGQNPVWGPDSRHLLFARDNGLFMMDTFTGQETKIVSNLGKIYEPAWSR